MTTYDVIDAYYRYFNAGHFAGMLDLLSDDVSHAINQGGITRGKEAFKDFLQEMAHHYREELHDICILVSADGSRAAAEFTCKGTYLKTQAGLPPAHNQSYSLPVGAFFQLRDGRITRVTTYYNLPDWISQVKG